MKISLIISILLPTILFPFGLISCSEKSSTDGPMIITPPNAKVDLSQVSMKLRNVKITRKHNNSYSLTFDYTLINKAGATLSFQSIFSGKDDLIEVNLSDQDGYPVDLGKRPQEGLTLAATRAVLIPKGKSTRPYTVPVTPQFRQKGDMITVRVRLHAPSRYDELRSTIEAPIVTAPWPESPKMETSEKLDPISEDNPLTSPSPEATYPTR